MATFAPLPHSFRLRAETSSNSVLLETSRPSDHASHSYLFENPASIISTTNLGDVADTLRQAEAAANAGSFVAGYIAYEAGYAFEPSLSAVIHATQFASPLIWMGVYPRVEVFNHHQDEIATTDETRTDESRAPSVQPRELQFNMSQSDYTSRVNSIRHWIERGDTYQANLTMEAAWNEASSPASLFQRFMQSQPVEFGALIHSMDAHIISASPELFFRSSGSQIITRPMKGTAPRGRWADEDDLLAQWLRNDPKNRAENLMIVDLLRNDLGRICTHGSIHVSDLFKIERFPTVLQMTSAVEGELQPATGFAAIMRALFPSGSIVGAPKIRTMQILRELEQRNRGVYTGAIGFLSPNGDATFSVAIRTAVLRNHTATMGIGSGIVYDSDPASEFEECKVKASFVAQAPQDFDLIETLLYEHGFAFLNEHLTRLEASAHFFDFSFDRKVVEDALTSEAHSFSCGGTHRVRLLLNKRGACTVTSTPIAPPAPNETVTVLLAADHTSSTDRMLFHKTTARMQYTTAHSRALELRCADAIFLNERDEITEGAIHNIVLVRNGKWITPPVESGLLRGIYRDHLLRIKPDLREEVVRLDDLLNADEIYLCNSVRGLRRVSRVLQETPAGARLMLEHLL